MKFEYCAMNNVRFKGYCSPSDMSDINIVYSDPKKEVELVWRNCIDDYMPSSADLLNDDEVIELILKRMHELGGDGWELVGVSPAWSDPREPEHSLMFKRQVE